MPHGSEQFSCAFAQLYGPSRRRPRMRDSGDTKKIRQQQCRVLLLFVDDEVR
jgi:hypothetical protein